jgi:carbon starvation protein CstA
MSQDPGVREFPGAVADYAAGIADVLARGGFAVAIVGLLLGVLLAALVGGGIVLVLVAAVLPAIAVGLWLEVPSRLRERLG